MSTRPPLVDLSALADRSRERFESFAARFAAGARKAAPPALTDDYWPSLRDLFTRGLTHQGLRELLQQETQDTFRFLTRAGETSPTSPPAPGTCGTRRRCGGSSSPSPSA